MSRRFARDINNADLLRELGDEFLLNTQQAALYLQVSESTLNHWRSDGDGPRFVRIGTARGAVRYRMSDIRAYVESRVFSSTAEAQMATAMARVSADMFCFTCEHPFVVRGQWLIIDSAYAEENAYLDIFRDPYVKLSWIKPQDAVCKPWVREARRLEVVEAFLQRQEDRLSAAKAIEARYLAALSSFPESHYGSHPALTIDALKNRLQSRLSKLQDCS